jgi:hypothetical protein
MDALTAERFGPTVPWREARTRPGPIRPRRFGARPKPCTEAEISEHRAVLDEAMPRAVLARLRDVRLAGAIRRWKS